MRLDSHNQAKKRGGEMKKIVALLVLVELCAVSGLPLLTHAQNEVAEQHRAEVSLPIHQDKTSKPLREMFETGERPEPARGGRDFEPGRPEPVGNVNPSLIDASADRSVGLPSALSLPKGATVATPPRPNPRVAPPDATAAVGPK